MVEYLREMISKSKPGEKYGAYPHKTLLVSTT